MSQPPVAVSVASTVRDSREYLIAGAGIVTSVTTVALNFAIDRWTDFNFLSLSFWFVIPAGAFLGGFAAASGYYFAAQWTQIMPTRRLLLDMVGIGLSTWLLARWLEYATATLSDGTSVSQVASFWEYFKVSAEHMQLVIRTRTNVRGVETGELGAFGYAREGLSLLGFLAGGFATWAHLDGLERCDNCRRYANVRKVLDNASAEVFDSVLDRAGLTLPGLVDDAKVALGSKPFSGLTLWLAECRGCGSQWLRPALVIPGRESAEERKLRRYLVNSDSAAATAAASADAQPPKNSRR